MPGLAFFLRLPNTSTEAVGSNCDLSSSTGCSLRLMNLPRLCSGSSAGGCGGGTGRGSSGSLPSEVPPSRAPASSVSVINDPSCDDLTIYADPLLIKAFSNLIDNTARHGGRATRVRLSCRQSPDGIVIVCEDDGRGIPDSEKDLIFERDYGKNTGYGLFLTREILAITGLTIRETGEEGKGVRFEILVPHGSFR